MTLDPSVVGTVVVDAERSWTASDACLYALGVGAGASDPAAELDLTTDNTDGSPQRVLPSFAVVLATVPGHSALDRIGRYDKAMLVHGEQSFTLHRPLPAAGRVRIETRVVAIVDKGSGALVVTETTAHRVEDTGPGPLFETRASYFVRGEQGFGGDLPGGASWTAPDRAPDDEMRHPVRADQALLYRLSGDRNPLHSDPAVAGRAGFPRPILQGLCTFGIAARCVGRAGGDALRVRSMSGRFTRPVMPGGELVTRLWVEADEVRFRCLSDDVVVLDRGRALLGSAS